MSRKRSWSGTAAKKRRLQRFESDPTCYYCGKELKFNLSTLDHKIPRSRGGRNDFENTVLCCYECNQEKADKTSEEYIDEIVEEATLRRHRRITCVINRRRKELRRKRREGLKLVGNGSRRNSL